MPFVQFTSGGKLNNSVFVSIASVDDEELFYSVKSIYENSKRPENIYVGIYALGNSRKLFKQVKQIAKEYPNVRYIIEKQKKNNIDTLGAGRGRSKSYSLYKNEDYFLQVDSHTYFFKSWDTKMISLFDEASKELNTKKIVLTCIPPIYGYDVNEKVVRFGNNRYPEWQRGRLYVNAVPAWSDFDVLSSGKYPKFIPAVKACPAMMFGDKNFASDIGVNEDCIFYDEDLVHTYELFGRGVRLVFPNVENFPIAHLDSDRIIDGHDRTFFLKYLDEEHDKKLHEKLKNNYLKYINDPENKEKISKYKSYAKVDPIIGYFSSVEQFVPKDYI